MQLKTRNYKMINVYKRKNWQKYIKKIKFVNNEKGKNNLHNNKNKNAFWIQFL